MLKCSTTALEVEDQSTAGHDLAAKPKCVYSQFDSTHKEQQFWHRGRRRGCGWGLGGGEAGGKEPKSKLNTISKHSLVGWFFFFGGGYFF